VTKNTTISIPTVLYNKIETFLEDRPHLGYISATEFIKESIRRSIERQVRIERDMQIIKQDKL
jgi:Arc/MetJ-type ribon-helix-helix transcriptional regulator